MGCAASNIPPHAAVWAMEEAGSVVMVESFPAVEEKGIPSASGSSAPAVSKPSCGSPHPKSPTPAATPVISIPRPLASTPVAVPSGDVSPAEECEEEVLRPESLRKMRNLAVFLQMQGSQGRDLGGQVTTAATDAGRGLGATGYRTARNKFEEAETRYRRALLGHESKVIAELQDDPVNPGKAAALAHAQSLLDGGVGPPAAKGGAQGTGSSEESDTMYVNCRGQLWDRRALSNFVPRKHSLRRHLGCAEEAGDDGRAVPDKDDGELAGPSHVPRAERLPRTKTPHPVSRRVPSRDHAAEAGPAGQRAVNRQASMPDIGGSGERSLECRLAIGYEELRRREETLGANHPGTLLSVSSVADLLMSQGRLDEAEPLCWRLFQWCERKLGTTHPKTLLSVNSLTQVLHRQNKLDEAEALGRRGHQWHEAALGPQHTRTLSNFDRLVAILESQGKTEEAKLLQRQQESGVHPSSGGDAKDGGHPARLRRSAAYRGGA